MDIGQECIETLTIWVFIIKELNKTELYNWI